MQDNGTKCEPICLCDQLNEPLPENEWRQADISRARAQVALQRGTERLRIHVAVDVSWDNWVIEQEV